MNTQRIPMTNPTPDIYTPGVCCRCGQSAPVLMPDGSGFDEGVDHCKPCYEWLMAYMADPLGDCNPWWPYGERDESRHWE